MVGFCRRRWKQIVEEYIRSDHAESMRKRNSVVFGEYQLSTKSYVRHNNPCSVEPQQCNYPRNVRIFSLFFFSRYG